MTDAAAADSTLLAAAGDDYDDWSSSDIEQNNGQLQSGRLLMVQMTATLKAFVQDEIDGWKRLWKGHCRRGSVLLECRPVALFWCTRSSGKWRTLLGYISAIAVSAPPWSQLCVQFTAWLCNWWERYCWATWVYPSIPCDSFMFVSTDVMLPAVCVEFCWSLRRTLTSLT